MEKPPQTKGGPGGRVEGIAWGSGEEGSILQRPGPGNGRAALKHREGPHLVGVVGFVLGRKEI